MRIATWNVNGIKARTQHLLDWLKLASPDVVLLQEIKCQDDGFPRLEVEAEGYQVALVGQKSYNGVAVLSRQPIEVLGERLPGDDSDEQARFLEVRTGGLRVASLYIPNGNPTDDPAKFDYKLAWLKRLIVHVQGLLKSQEAFVLGGDWNVAPDDIDAYDPKAWADDALLHPRTRQVYRQLVNLGLTDAFRALHPEAGRYTWWDYRAGAWSKDQGLRIDHLLLSPQAADRLGDVGIDRRPRDWEKPSDHTPVWCDIT